MALHLLETQVRRFTLPTFSTEQEISQWLTQIDTWANSIPAGVQATATTVPMAQAPFALVQHLVSKVHYPLQGQNYGYAQTPEDRPVILYVIESEDHD